MMAEVLVIGATGNVSFLVVQALQRRGVSVRAFVRNLDKAKAMFRPDIEVAIGDLSNPNSIRDAMAGVKRVFLACSNSPCQVEQEKNVIDAAQAVGARQIVKLSAIGAEVGSPLAFWDHHGQIEDYLHASGVPAVILRPNFYMSNLLASAETIAHTGTIFAPISSAPIALIDPRDVAEAAVVLLTGAKGHEATYLLSGPEALTHGQIAAQLAEATGRPIKYVDVPDEAARQSMLAAGTPEWFANNLVTLYGVLRQGRAAQTTDTLQNLTGHPPRRFAEFARDHASLFSG